MLFALGGILCLILGGALTYYSSRRYSGKRYVVDAASCRMNLLEVQKADLPPAGEAGSVVLFHGLSANQNIMQYLAHSFAEVGLRVFVPDLPGHGRSPGPFTPERAETCGGALVRGLAARGMLTPDRTILAGHSLGGAIALRVAEKFRPAGVIAISPAPMQAAHGVIDENLLFHGVPRIAPKTRIIVGQFEPAGLVENAADLAAGSGNPTTQFTMVPYNTHVSVLFSPTVAIDSQAWASLVLSLPEAARLPSRANLLGALLGLAGVLLLAGPCIRDLVGKEPREDRAPAGSGMRWRGAVEVALISLLAVFLLHYWQPLRVIHLFEGDYLAGFFLLSGTALGLIHLAAGRAQFRMAWGTFFGSAFAAFLLQFLISGWFELTATSAWLSLQRWIRFPLFLLVAFLYLYGLELLAGPVTNPRRRYAYWFLLVELSWAALAVGVHYMKSGQILLVLLSPYFALLFLLSGLGMQLVRRLTGSATAAAVFGAILLAGFSLALFPVS